MANAGLDPLPPSTTTQPKRRRASGPSWTWIAREFGVAVVAWILGVGSLFLKATRDRTFDPRDLSIDLPMRPDSVSDEVMGAASVILPVVTALVTEWLVHRRGIAATVKAAAPMAIGSLVANAITEVLTNVVKVFAGEPRPDFLARCQSAIPPNHRGALTVAACTGDAKLVDQGLKAFPSGHASLFMCGMLYMALYWRHALAHPAARRVVGVGLPHLVGAMPVLAALVMGVSRVADNHHDGYDVTAGLVLGAAVALATFPLYLPPYHDEAGSEPVAAASSDTEALLGNGDAEANASTAKTSRRKP
ncbi:hypothetical protein H9P43_000618 [Blastocladiella emersonii ATCC 22665]|nr:hypothetical protein H9P43_000618 [Blastocladiella emersonii ATCC 22665]